MSKRCGLMAFHTDTLANKTLSSWHACDEFPWPNGQLIDGLWIATSDIELAMAILRSNNKIDSNKLNLAWCLIKLKDCCYEARPWPLDSQPIDGYVFVSWLTCYQSTHCHPDFVIFASDNRQSSSFMPLRVYLLSYQSITTWNMLMFIMRWYGFRLPVEPRASVQRPKAGSTHRLDSECD